MTRHNRLHVCTPFLGYSAGAELQSCYVNNRIKPERQYTYNATARRVHETSVLPRETNKYYIFLCTCLCACAHARGCTGAGMCLRACSLTYRACKAPPYFHLRPVWFLHIFQLHLINATIFGKTLLNIKCLLLFSLHLLSKTFLILRRIQRDIVVNVKTFTCKITVILVGFE